MAWVPPSQKSPHQVGFAIPGYLCPRPYGGHLALSSLSGHIVCLAIFVAILCQKPRPCHDHLQHRASSVCLHLAVRQGILVWLLPKGALVKATAGRTPAPGGCSSLPRKDCSTGPARHHRGCTEFRCSNA